MANIAWIISLQKKDPSSSRANKAAPSQLQQDILKKIECCVVFLQVPYDDVSTVFNNNLAANKVSTGVFNQYPNALVAGGAINTFDSLFNSKAGSNAAKVTAVPCNTWAFSFWLG